MAYVYLWVLFYKSLCPIVTGGSGGTKKEGYMQKVRRLPTGDATPEVVRRRDSAEAGLLSCGGICKPKIASSLAFAGEAQLCLASQAKGVRCREMVEFIPG